MDSWKSRTAEVGTRKYLFEWMKMEQKNRALDKRTQYQLVIYWKVLMKQKTKSLGLMCATYLKP